MTTALFEEWVSQFNRKMKRQNRNVILFVDNAPSHPKDKQLSNAKLVFLPANTTSMLQPPDEGIIANLKVNYRKRLLRSVLAKVDKGEEIDKINKCIFVLASVMPFTGSAGQ